MQGVHGRCSLRRQMRLHAANCPLHPDSSWIQRMDELAAMKLLVAGHNGIDDRNSDASADIPQQVVKTAGVADLFVFQKSHRGGGERNKHTPRSKAADDDCPQEGPLT